MFLRRLFDRIRGRKTPPDAGGPPGIPQGQYGAAVHGKHTSYITRPPLAPSEEIPLAEPTTRKLGGLQGKEKGGSGDDPHIAETSAFSPSKEDRKPPPDEDTDEFEDTDKYEV